MFLFGDFFPTTRSNSSWFELKLVVFLFAKNYSTPRRQPKCFKNEVNTVPKYFTWIYFTFWHSRIHASGLEDSIRKLSALVITSTGLYRLLVPCHSVSTDSSIHLSCGREYQAVSWLDIFPLIWKKTISFSEPLNLD